MKRRLVTILATDIAGYSHHMEVAEEITAELVATYRDQFASLATKHGGRLFGSAGDSFIFEFVSPLEAVRCAIDIQELLKRRNTGKSADEKFKLRIGINLGDVIVDGANLLGDCVNIAARLESLADPGGILASSSVYEQIKKYNDFDITFQGNFKVKNIEEPIPAYRIDKAGKGKARNRINIGIRPFRKAITIALPIIAAAGLFVYLSNYQNHDGVKMLLDLSTTDSPESIDAIPNKASIAVLPFNNFTGDPDLEYLSDGFTEDITTALAKFSGLLVINRHSAFFYKSKSIDLREIRNSLGVRYVLEGSIQHDGNKTRINAQLIETEQGQHLWSERYDISQAQIFEVRDSVTQQIASTLMGSDSGEIVRSEFQRTSKLPDERATAYDFLMRGWERWYKFTALGNRQARTLFERAIEADPGYARAYSALAWTYAEAYEQGWASDYEMAVNLARKNAETGYKLDPSDYRSHWALGWSYLYSWEHDKAGEHYEKALKLNPNDAELYAEMSNYLIYTGQADRAIEHLLYAMRLNPLHEVWYTENLGWAYEEAERPADAIRELEKITNPPEWIRRTLAAAYAANGEMDKAREQVDLILKANPGFDITRHENYIRDNFPYKNDALINRWIEALKKTGIAD